MGAYSTAAILDDQMRDWLVTHVARPVVAGSPRGMSSRHPVLRVDDDGGGPMVLEFNLPLWRSRDAADLMRLESDFWWMRWSVDEGSQRWDFQMSAMRRFAWCGHRVDTGNV